MLPSDIEVLLSDGHVLVKGHHVRSLVVIGPTEEMSQEKDHGRVQFGNVRDVLKEEIVDAVVCEHELVELSNYFLELVVATYLLEYRGHLEAIVDIILYELSIENIISMLLGIMA